MDLQQLGREVESLKSAVSRLQQEVAALRQAQMVQNHPIVALLQQRGLPILAHGERTQLLLSPTSSPAQAAHFYQLMRRYSFRLFVRDLIRFPQGPDVNVLSRYCTPKTARSYLNILSELGMVQLHPHGGYRLMRQVASFGPTLEWYVAEIFQREFLAPALFNVRLRNTEYGGDYDVITVLAEHLVYVEVKSSPPRGVEQPAVSAFLDRLRDLQPHVAVFLVDTELRMRDKMVPLFTEALKGRHSNQEEWPVVRLVNELFHICHGIYVINSRKGIYTNLRLCFRDFLKWQGKSKLPNTHSSWNKETQ